MFTKKSTAESILEDTKKLYSGIHEHRLCSLAEFPHLDHNFYEDGMREIESFGFRFVADLENLTIKEGMFDPRALIRVGLDFDGSTVSAQYQIKPRIWWRILFWILRIRLGKVTEFETEFEDGTFVTTSNASNAAMLDSPPLLFPTFLPDSLTIEALLEHHRQSVAEHCEIKNTVPKKLYTAQDIIESQHRMELIKSEFRERIGWIKKSEWDRLARNPNEDTDEIYDEFARLREEQTRTAIS